MLFSLVWIRIFVRRASKGAGTRPVGVKLRAMWRSTVWGQMWKWQVWAAVLHTSNSGSVLSQLSHKPKKIFSKYITHIMSHINKLLKCTFVDMHSILDEFIRFNLTYFCMHSLNASCLQLLSFTKARWLHSHPADGRCPPAAVARKPD